MIIKSVSLYKCEVSVGFQYSTWRNDLSSSYLIKIESEDGLSGWGEYVTNRWKTEKILTRLARQLIGKNVEDILKTNILNMPLPNSLAEWVIGFDRRRRLIREGMSIALLDLWGKSTGKLFSDYFTDRTRNTVSGMPVIHVFPIEVRGKIFKIWERAGYDFFKLKLKGDLEEDIAAIKLISSLKNTTSRILIIDANYGYTNPQDILELSRVAKKHDVGFFQDPIKMPFRKLERLMNVCDVPFTADNTAWWPNTKRVLSHDVCGLLNHHPNIQGGMDWLMRSATLAQQKGVDNIIGSSGLFGIQNAAFQNMAGITGLNYPCEEISLVPYYELLEDYYKFSAKPSVLKDDIPIENGKIILPTLPGLGIDVDMEKLNAVKKWEHHIE